MSQVLLLLIPAIVSFHLGIYVYLGNRSGQINRLILAISILVALWNIENALVVLHVSSGRLVSLARIGGVFLAPSFLHLVLILVRYEPRWRKWLLAGVYGLGLVLYLWGGDPHLLGAFFFAIGSFAKGSHWVIPLSEPLLYLYSTYFAFCMAFSLWLLGRAWLREPSREGRERLLLVGVASLAAILLSAAGCSAPQHPVSFSLMVFASFLYLSAVSWNVWRYGLADLSLFMRENIIYSLALGGVGGLYFLFAITGGRVLEKFFQIEGTTSSLLAAMLVAPTFYPVKEWLEASLKRFRPLQRDRFEEVLKNMTLEINRFFSVEELVHFLASRLISLLNLTGLCLLYYSPKGSYKWSCTVKDGQVNCEADVIFEEKALAQARSPCVGEDEQVVMNFPLRVGEQEIGRLVLHRKDGGEMLTPEEKRLFAIFTAQLGMTLENIQLHEQLLEKGRQIQRTERLSALGRLTAGLAHEIRNGLYKIGGCAYILKDELANQPYLAEVAAGVAEETDSLAAFLDKFLSFAQEKKGEVTVFPLKKVVEDVLFSLQQEIKEREVGLRCYWPETEVLVAGDRRFLQQAVLNLVLNALEAMGKGGVLTIRLAQRGSTCWLDITDTGPGIAPDDLEKIFDPFFTTKQEGTGLGLSITAQVIRDHGGEIRVSSRLGEGTTFTVILPVKEKGEAGHEGADC